MSEDDVENADPEVINFIFSQSEKYLSAQLTASIASDQRAIAISATFLGFCSAILAAALGYYAARTDTAILVSGLVSGVGFFLAAALGFYASRPVDFYFPGNQPENWYACLSDRLHDSIWGEVENYSEEIEYNQEIMDKNAKILIYSVVLAASAPIIGIVCYLAISLFCRV